MFRSFPLQYFYCIFDVNYFCFSSNVFLSHGLWCSKYCVPCYPGKFLVVPHLFGINPGIENCRSCKKVNKGHARNSTSIKDFLFSFSLIPRFIVIFSMNFTLFRRHNFFSTYCFKSFLILWCDDLSPINRETSNSSHNWLYTKSLTGQF